MTDILHCAKCQKPLKVVCDAHGTEWVPERKPEPVEVKSVKLRRADSQRARILTVISLDAGHPSSTADVVSATGLPVKLIAPELANMCKAGFIERASRGRYFRRGV